MNLFTVITAVVFLSVCLQPAAAANKQADEACGLQVNLALSKKVTVVFEDEQVGFVRFSPSAAPAGFLTNRKTRVTLTGTVVGEDEDSISLQVDPIEVEKSAMTVVRPVDMQKLPPGFSFFHSKWIEHPNADKALEVGQVFEVTYVSKKPFSALTSAYDASTFAGLGFRGDILRKIQGTLVRKHETIWWFQLAPVKISKKSIQSVNNPD